MSNPTDNSPPLFRPDLWDALVPGILAARQAGDEYISSKKYFPRRDKVEYSEHESWPHTTLSLYDPFAKGSVDWRRLFDEERGKYTYLAIAEIPSMRDAVDHVANMAQFDNEVVRVVGLLASLVESEDERMKYIRHEIVLFIGQILNRADSIGASSEADLKEIYRSLEKARLSPELDGDIIVPLVAVALSNDEPIHIRDNVWIEALTEADHRGRALSHDPNNSANAFVAASATHAVVLRNMSFKNEISPFDSRYAVLQELDLSVVNDVEVGIHLLTNSITGHAQVLIRPHDWADNWVDELPPLSKAWAGRAYPESLNDREWTSTFKRIDSDVVREVARLARELESAPSNVRVSARRYRNIAFRSDPEDSILDAAIGIEALLGKERDAITHRLAQRAAVVLTKPYGREAVSPKTTYQLVKKLYEARSRIAHGSESKKLVCKINGDEYPAAGVGQLLLGELLKSRLLGEDPWDAESLDERLLTSLLTAAEQDDTEGQEHSEDA